MPNTKLNSKGIQIILTISSKRGTKLAIPMVSRISMMTSTKETHDTINSEIAKKIPAKRLITPPTFGAAVEKLLPAEIKATGNNIKTKK